MIGKTLKPEIYWTDRGIIALQSLHVSYLSDDPFTDNVLLDSLILPTKNFEVINMGHFTAKAIIAA